MLSDAPCPTRRLRTSSCLNAPSGAQCFPTMTGIRPKATGDASQCTFWCSVLSDSDAMSWTSTFSCVSMHLLVLSAFRRSKRRARCGRLFGLNAPSGAQCFPTKWTRSSPFLYGSQCTFWCSVLSDVMFAELLQDHFPMSQCTFWCSVLSDTKRSPSSQRKVRRSQCTFWCSVLSDRKPTIGRCQDATCLNAPSGAQCFPT